MWYHLIWYKGDFLVVEWWYIYIYPDIYIYILIYIDIIGQWTMTGKISRNKTASRKPWVFVRLNQVGSPRLRWNEANWGYTWKILMSYPIGSMYGIYANIGGILMVNVTIYSIHGSYGYRFVHKIRKKQSMDFFGMRLILLDRWFLQGQGKILSFPMHFPLWKFFLRRQNLCWLWIQPAAPGHLEDHGRGPRDGSEELSGWTESLLVRDWLMSSGVKFHYPSYIGDDHNPFFRDPTSILFSITKQ